MVDPRLASFNLIWDRLQLVVFFVQETALSTLYIYQTRKYLHDSSLLTERSWSAPTSTQAGTQTETNEQRRMLWQLIYTNILVIALDITLLGIQCADLFYLQGAFKPCVYGIKLKVEFVILNRLINSIQARSRGEVQHRNGTGSSGSAGRQTRHNGVWHKTLGVKFTFEDHGVELVHSNAGNDFRSPSRESRAPILPA
jgi:hypothetical protein